MIFSSTDLPESKAFYIRTILPSTSKITENKQKNILDTLSADTKAF